MVKCKYGKNDKYINFENIIINKEQQVFWKFENIFMIYNMKIQVN